MSNSPNPYQDQKPGTSGLRKKVSVFQQEGYVEYFTQAILDVAKPKLLVLGGDGRYFTKEAINRIVLVCAANNVDRIVIGTNGILSTPAASALIRELKADGGIILTASHNPGGPDGDFGIKYNINNGGPAPETITDKIYETSKKLQGFKKYSPLPGFELDLSQPHCKRKLFAEVNTFYEVDYSIMKYYELMERNFYLKAIKGLFEDRHVVAHRYGKNLKILIDCMNGVTGPYVDKIFGYFGVPESSIINAQPLEDFGGLHPDPNLTYAKDLVHKLQQDETIDFGCAFDGDGDRVMILGSGGFFVSPGDSLAVLGAHKHRIPCIKHAQGFARSFPTSPAIDRVAERTGVRCFETPTGWKYFGNLMDAKMLDLCGEESFGTGSSHIREKDGIWTVLAWLSIISDTGKSVKELVEDLWRAYGRDYFFRYDFENCDTAKCQEMIEALEKKLSNPSFVGTKFGTSQVRESGNFSYTDPTDGTVTEKQGLYVKFTNESRIIVRLSGTGSEGATVRIYASAYSKDSQLNCADFMKDLLNIAFEITKLPKYIGRTEPTVIT